MTLIEERPTEPLSVGNPDHAFDPNRFGRITNQIKDCSKVYSTQIGEVPADKLKALGIEPVIYAGPIADIAV